MEIFGTAWIFIPFIKAIIFIGIAAIVCFMANLPFLSKRLIIQRMKPITLLVLVGVLIYLNLYEYNLAPYIILIPQIAVLIMCYQIYLSMIKRLLNAQHNDESHNRYIEEIKRKNTNT